jgi:hypothetical protein
MRTGILADVFINIICNLKKSLETSNESLNTSKSYSLQKKRFGEECTG